MVAKGTQTNSNAQETEEVTCPMGGRWERIVETIFPELTRRLEQRFRARATVSPESRLLSAVRVYLDREKEGLLFIETDDELSRYLYVVAWRKINQALQKEHLDQRVPLNLTAEACESIISYGCEELSKEFESFLNSLSPQQRLWVAARTEDKTADQIQRENGWTETELDTVRKSVQRKARSLREGRGGA